METTAWSLSSPNAREGISTPSGRFKAERNIESPTSNSATSTSRYSGRLDARQVISILFIKRDIAPPCILTPIQLSSFKNLTGTDILILVSGFTL